MTIKLDDVLAIQQSVSDLSKEGTNAFHNLVRQIKQGLCAQLENTKNVEKRDWSVLKRSI